MEFHGIWLCSQISWNFKNSMEFHGTFVLGLAIPWNSMEFVVGIKFHGTFKVPWNSMELPFWPEKFPWISMDLLSSSMEFHGIPWNCEILILINFIIEEVYFTVCYMISCYHISNNPLVVELLKYFNSKAIFGAPHFAQMAIFHYKWRPVCIVYMRLNKFTHYNGLSKWYITANTLRIMIVARTF